MHLALEPLRPRDGWGAERPCGRVIAPDPVARFERLLEWLARQDFAKVSAGEPSLLRQAEQIVIESHRRLYEEEGRAWSKAVAYRWLRFEDPMPVARLQQGVKELVRKGARFNPDAVEKVSREAEKDGFSY